MKKKQNKKKVAKKVSSKTKKKATKKIALEGELSNLSKKLEDAQLKISELTKRIEEVEHIERLHANHNHPLHCNHPATTRIC